MDLRNSSTLKAFKPYALCCQPRRNRRTSNLYRFLDSKGFLTGSTKLGVSFCCSCALVTLLWVQLDNKSKISHSTSHLKKSRNGLEVEKSSPPQFQQKKCGTFSHFRVLRVSWIYDLLRRPAGPGVNFGGTPRAQLDQTQPFGPGGGIQRTLPGSRQRRNQCFLWSYCWKKSCTS